jgi:hypothetical protein
MAASFHVYTTSRFDRLAKALNRRRQEFAVRYQEVITILALDPYNHSRKYQIKKLIGIKKEEANWRIRLVRFRFRYSVVGTKVIMHFCGLRDGGTYK